MAPVCRSYRKRTVDLVGTDGTDGFHPDILKDGKAKTVTAMEYYCWRVMQRNGRA